MPFVEKTGKNRWRVRYWRDDGTHGSIPGFPTKKAAQDKAKEIDSDQGRGTFLDPSAGKLSLDEWSHTWFGALDVEPATESQYRCLYRNHIQPRWGAVCLSDITGSAVHVWAKKFRGKGYAENTVRLGTKILSMMLADAVDERLIPANPIRPARRGRRRGRTHHKEAVWATPEQALRIALQAAALVGPWAGVLMITAAWTGARWGELTGLQRRNTHLDQGTIVIDADVGALHEVDGVRSLGPPKTLESARTIQLPPFLIDLLRTHLASHDHPHVFVTAEGELLRRSNFARRAMRPAADGTLHAKSPRMRLQPVAPKLTFHGFRHSHKTWLIADGIPDVAQARRLGHVLPDKIQHIYSHVAPEVEHRLLTTLEDRWEAAVASLQESAAATTAASRLEVLPALNTTRQTA